MSADARGRIRRSARPLSVGLVALVFASGVVGCTSGDDPQASELSDGATTAGAATEEQPASTTSASDSTEARAGHVYTLARTQRCLNQAGLHAYRNPSNKIVMGSGGELRVVFSRETDWIYIAFGKNAKESQAIQDRAVRATRRQYPQVDAKTVIATVRRKGNVFYYADGGPVTQEEGQQIDACLR